MLRGAGVRPRTEPSRLADWRRKQEDLPSPSCEGQFLARACYLWESPFGRPARALERSSLRQLYWGRVHPWVGLYLVGLGWWSAPPDLPMDGKARWEGLVGLPPPISTDGAYAGSRKGDGVVLQTSCGYRIRLYPCLCLWAPRGPTATLLSASCNRPSEEVIRGRCRLVKPASDRRPPWRLTAPEAAPG